MNKTKSIALVLRKKHSIRQPTELKIFFEKTVQYLYSYHLNIKAIVMCLLTKKCSYTFRRYNRSLHVTRRQTVKLPLGHPSMVFPDQCYYDVPLNLLTPFVMGKIVFIA